MMPALLLGCGEPSPSSNVIISGSVSGAVLEEYPDHPVIVMVSHDADMNAIRNDPMNTLIAYAGVDPSTRSFRLDLQDSGLLPGDTVFIAAFIDLSPADRAPYPGTGDWIGFWMNPLTFSTMYTVAAGENNITDIRITREIFDFQAAVSGTVQGEEIGGMLLFAYVGPLTSLSPAALDPDRIIGYTSLIMTGTPVEYLLPILPFGFDTPIENVLILSILDSNQNGLPDAEDKIGYHTTAPPYPTPVTINEGLLTDVDVWFF
ncbi:MAG: hypothetical protein ABIK15_08010 [Pseudomonadota bacterium]